MYITYYIEHIESNNVVEYLFRLKDAKECLMQVGNKYRIVQIKGNYKYEGYHQYYLYLNKNKFKKVKIR